MDEDELVRVAKALADPTRFAVLRELAAAGPLSVGELVTRTGVSQPTVSHHARTLAECGLVTVRHVGQQSVFRVADGAVEGFCHGLRTALVGDFRLPDLGWGVID